MTKSKIKIAVLGATGNVGRNMLNVLHEHDFPTENITALASSRSSHKSVSYGEDDVLKVQDVEKFDFSDVDVVLSSIGSKAIKDYADKITAKAYLIDNSSAFRMDEDVPLIIPEVNPEEIKKAELSGIVSNPNCSMIQMAVALKPLDEIVKIKRVVVSTYQSVSGAGKKAMDELFNQTRAVFMNDSKKPEHFPRPIAFNLIPQIDWFDENGDTGEETKIINEFSKVMGRKIACTATCVRVPVFVGHSMAVNVEFEDAITPKQAISALKSSKGISVVQDLENYTTPLECVGEDPVFVSRIRQDQSAPHALNMWIVADNLRKGAALNAVQILELMIKDKIL